MSYVRGKLIVFEGIDGCGKTTQIEKLKTYLIENELKVYCINNVTGGKIGKLIRDVIGPDHKELYINNYQIANLFLAELHIVARRVHDLINSGYNVICSRWWYTTLAYAGTTDNEFKAILGMCQYEIEPDIVFYLNIDPKQAYKRIHKRAIELEVFERLDKLIQYRIRYTKALNQAADTTKIYNLDANGNTEAISSSINYLIGRDFKLV